MNINLLRKTFTSISIYVRQIEGAIQLLAIALCYISSLIIMHFTTLGHYDAPTRFESSWYIIWGALCERLYNVVKI